MMYQVPQEGSNFEPDSVDRVTDFGALDLNQLHLNTMDNPQTQGTIAIYYKDIIDCIQSSIQNKLNKICPSWIESLEYFERHNKLTVSIKLAARPLKGQIPAFQNEFLKIAGAPVDFVYSAGKGLQSIKAEAPEKVQRKVDLAKIINESLPDNIQLTNFWLYHPKVGNKTHPILLCQIMSDERQDQALRAWQEKFEDEHKIDILIKRDWVKPALTRMLSKHIQSENNVIGVKDIPAIKRLKTHFFGSKDDFKDQACEKYLNEEYLQDLTSREFLWFTPDDVETLDREDQICARRLSTGEIEIYIAIIDPSTHVRPKSAIEEYAAKIGSTHYMRNSRLPTLPGNISYYHASFLPGKDRRSIVLRYTFDENAQGLVKKPEFMWAKTRSHGNISPNSIPEILNGNISADNIRNVLVPGASYETAIKIHGSLFLLAECLPALKAHIRGQGELYKNAYISFRRSKASGLGGDIVTNTMIAIKSELPKLLYENGIDFISSNQRYPDQEYLLDLEKILQNKGINLLGDEFTNVLAFKELLQFLDRQKEYVLYNQIMHKYMLKTTLDLKSTGFQALNVSHYMNIKPRDYDGLINNMIAVAFLSKSPLPYTRSELEERLKIARKVRRQHESMGYLYRVLSSVERHAANQGKIYRAQIIGQENQHHLVKVDGFSHTTLLIPNHSKNLNPGEHILVRFLGLNHEQLDAYLFELVDDE